MVNSVKNQPPVSQPMLAAHLQTLIQRLAQESHCSRLDHREAERVAVSVQAPIQLGISDVDDQFKPLYVGWITDLSESGLSVLTECDLPTGVTIAINLEPLAARCMVVPIRIAYCKQLMTSTYRVGAMFDFDFDPGRGLAPTR